MSVTREEYDRLFDLYVQMGRERDAAIAEVEARQKWTPITEPPTEDGYYLVAGDGEHAEVWYWESPYTEIDDWEAGGRVWNLGACWDTHLGNGEYKDVSAEGDDNWATHYRKIDFPSRADVMTVLDQRYDTPRDSK